MFGAGYATAEDRLFFIDVLRHARPRRALLVRRRRAGQPRCSTDRSGPIAPYSEADLQQQFDLGRRPLRRRRARSSSRTSTTTSPASTSTSPRPSSTRLKMPGEYAAIDQPLGPDTWKVDRRDRHRLAGRRDLRQGRRRRARRAQLLQSCQKRFGADAGPPGVARLPRGRRPRGADHGPQRPALPLPGDAPEAPRRAASRSPTGARSRPRTSLRRSSSAAGVARRRRALGRPGILGNLPGQRGFRGRRPTRCSSPARESKTGHPLAVYRPAGRLLRAADPDGGGRPRARTLDARGAAVPRARTSTSSSATGATTPGAPPRPARTSSTPSR